MSSRKDSQSHGYFLILIGEDGKIFKARLTRKTSVLEGEYVLGPKLRDRLVDTYGILEIVLCDPEATITYLFRREQRDHKPQIFAARPSLEGFDNLEGYRIYCKISELNEDVRRILYPRNFPPAPECG